MICCFAGLSVSASRTRYGMPRPLPRTATGCWRAIWRPSFWSQDKIKRLLSSEHFSVDGTLLEAWASRKSFRPKDGSGDPPGPGHNGERDFHGERRSNDTQLSTTDTDARLARKGPGKEARLCFMGHAPM